ncbi:MAG: hypothetical protein LQ338_003989 [Usnochroma carphineum]|nr:MAG: hypothetical protein LQ338_003989 [Usnochroma carphineum]
MTSLLSSCLLLLLAKHALAVPAPAPAATPPPAAQQAAEAELAGEFADAKSGLAAYSNIPYATSLSPEEYAAETSLLRYYATASFSDIPYATSIPASLAAQFDNPSGVEAPLPKQTDPCGPAVQDGTEFNTCTVNPDGKNNTDGSPFVYWTTDPSYYGVQCLPLNSQTNASSTSVPQLNTKNCAYESLCTAMQSEDFARGMWHWDTSGGVGCAIGVWLPSGDGVAQTPDKTRCRDGIYGMMDLYCADGGPQSQVAAVNLVKFPGGAAGTGQQANAGYPSYIIAPQVLM